MVQTIHCHTRELTYFLEVTNPYTLHILLSKRPLVSKTDKNSSAYFPYIIVYTPLGRQKYTKICAVLVQNLIQGQERILQFFKIQSGKAS